MLSFLQKEGVQGLASLFDNSAAILLLSITAEPVNKGNNNTNMDRGKYVIPQSPKECEIYILKKTQIVRQPITKLTFTQRCSLIHFASVHLYCDTNDLENIYSISCWIYHFFIREDFFNEQHKRIVMESHTSPLVRWCLFVSFFFVVLIMYIFQNFVCRSFCSLSTWRQVLLEKLPLLELPELLYVASGPHAHPQWTFHGPDQVLIDHQRVKCPRKTPPWKSVVGR